MSIISNEWKEGDKCYVATTKDGDYIKQKYLMNIVEALYYFETFEPEGRSKLWIEEGRNIREY